MKILPIIKSVGNDIKSTSKRVAEASTSGYNIALRKSRIHQNGDVITLMNIGKGVTKKVLRETTIDDLPIIAGAVGMFVPLPLASPIMLGLGKTVQLVVKAFKRTVKKG